MYCAISEEESLLNKNKLQDSICEIKSLALGWESVGRLEAVDTGVLLNL